MEEREKYRSLRSEKQISLYELAAILSCHKSHISCYERGLREMSKEKIQKYRNYINSKGSEAI